MTAGSRRPRMGRVGHHWAAMDADKSRTKIRRGRPVERVALPDGPARDLQKAIYRLYAEADCPRLDDLAETITADDTLPGSPKKDLISTIISGCTLASQQDTVTVAVALARIADRGDTDRMAQQVRRLWIAARTAPAAPAPARLGRPVGECDPLVLEVHPAIQVPGERGERLDRLPGYVPRAHDAQLREALDQMLVDRLSRLVTLVGGSSTGKTRACWELARYLKRQQPDRWWLWHPYDPTRPEATLADLDRVGPDTIVWLNEAQFYLAPTDARLGERIAAGLRSLLHDPRRGPVLVLATLWPQYWDALTTRPDNAQPDPCAQARDLLTGSMISVADRFTLSELAGLTDAGVDPRVRQAVAHAEAGRITQYLAGVPELQSRFDTAPPAARAIIQVAMDARRLGYPPALPRALLEQAAPGYLDDHDWDSLDEDWLEQALAYTARPCRGARGPLTRIRSRPGRPLPHSGQPCYRLADYLEQIGRRDRMAVFPPESLWTASAATVTDASLLRRLGTHARDRGRYQHAIRLYTPAADRGDSDALRALAELRALAGDTAGAEALVLRAADRGDSGALLDLAEQRQRAGNTAGAEALALLAADRGNTDVLHNLAGWRALAGDMAGAETLALLAADRGNTDSLRILAEFRAQVGDTAGCEALYRQAADRGDSGALVRLRERAGDTADGGNIFALRDRAQRRKWYADADVLRGLARLREQATDAGALRVLVRLRERAGDTAGAEALVLQAADAGALRVLVRLRERAGDTAGAEALVSQAANRGLHGALRILARLREQAGDTTGADRISRFGLTGSGDVASGLDFGS